MQTPYVFIGVSTIAKPYFLIGIGPFPNKKNKKDPQMTATKMFEQKCVEFNILTATYGKFILLYWRLRSTDFSVHGSSSVRVHRDQERYGHHVRPAYACASIDFCHGRQHISTTCAVLGPFSKKMSLKPHTVLSRNRLPLDPLVHYLRALPTGIVCGHIIF